MLFSFPWSCRSHIRIMAVHSPREWSSLNRRQQPFGTSHSRSFTTALSSPSPLALLQKICLQMLGSDRHSGFKLLFLFFFGTQFHGQEMTGVTDSKLYCSQSLLKSFISLSLTSHYTASRFVCGLQSTFKVVVLICKSDFYLFIFFLSGTAKWGPWCATAGSKMQCAAWCPLQAISGTAGLVAPSCCSEILLAAWRCPRRTPDALTGQQGPEHPGGSMVAALFG